MKKRPFQLGALLLSAALLVTACGGSKTAQPAATAKKTPLKIGYLMVMDDAPALLAQDAGFYAKHGLDVQLQMFNSGTDLIKAIAGGQLQAGILGFSNAVSWSATGADLKIVGGAQMGFHSLLVKKESPIQTVADLKGHSLASQSKGSTADIVLNGVVLPQANLKKSDVNVVEVTPAAAIQSLAAGKVDSAFVFEPYASMAKAAGNVREIYEIGKVWPFPCMVVVTSGKELSADRDAINRMLDAQKEAITLLQQQPANAANYLTKHFIQEDKLETDNGPVPSTQVIENAIKSQTFNWQITPDQVNRMNELVGIMQKQGILSKPVDINQVLDLSWQQSAGK